MLNNSRPIFRYATITIIIFAVVFFGLTFKRKQTEEQRPLPVVMVGLSKGEQEGLRIELEKAAIYENHINNGDQLAKEGKIEQAIDEYNMALSQAKFSGDKAIAFLHMADAYEKKKMYDKALELVIIVRDKYVNDWAKEPDIQRAVYLKYALEGEYDLAVEYAQKALDADAKLPNRPKGGRSDYIERLNDIKAAKDYIISLKKTK